MSTADYLDSMTSFMKLGDAVNPDYNMATILLQFLTYVV